MRGRPKGGTNKTWSSSEKYDSDSKAEKRSCAYNTSAGLCFLGRSGQSFP